MMRRLIVLVVAFAAPPSDAQPAGAQAEVLFREGRALMAQGKYAEACASFERSQQLDPTISTLLNLAGCREKNHQLATAWGLFLEAERQTRSATADATRAFHKVAQDRAAKLEARVSKLTINVPEKSQMPGLEITRDAERIDGVLWNRALPLDGGTYTVTARAPGANYWSTRVTIAVEGDTKTVEIPDLRNLAKDLDAVAPAEPATSAGKPTDTRTLGSSNKLAFAVGAGSVGLIGAGLGFELWGRSIYSDAKAEMADQARRDSLERSANTKHHIAQGLAVGGIACAGVAVWLYLRGRSHDESSATATRLVASPFGIALVGGF